MEKKLSFCIPYKDKMSVYCYFILFLLHSFKFYVSLHAYSVLQSCPTPFDPMECKPLDSSVHGVVPARILEWDVISFSRGSSRPRDQSRGSCISCIVGKFFTAEPTGKLPMYYCFLSVIIQLPLNVCVCVCVRVCARAFVVSILMSLSIWITNCRGSEFASFWSPALSTMFGQIRNQKHVLSTW